MPASAFYLRRHIDQVTSNLVALPALENNKTRDVQFTPGMTVEIPVLVQAGKKLRIEHPVQVAKSTIQSQFCSHPTAFR